MSIFELKMRARLRKSRYLLDRLTRRPQTFSRYVCR